MKTRALGKIALVVLCFVLPASTSADLAPDSARKTSPDFTLTDSTGAAIKLSGYKGRVVLLDFWATWCHPTGRNHAFAFHGHFVSVASVGAARWLNSDEGKNSEEHHVSILPQPVPIPGGINLPPVIHVFAPSDLDTEPTVITNFKGFSALAYPTGTNAAQDNNGNFYDVSNDMRVFQGEYVAADGSHHRGTFVFI